MKIVLASRNRKKIAELKTLLGEEIEIASLDDIGYPEEIVEDGESFAENAVIKAAVPASMGYIGVADDSGLTVDALDGAPGIYSARYAGENATDAENNAKLLRALQGVPVEKRGGAFVCTMAYVCPADLLSHAARAAIEAHGGRFHDAFASERTGVSLAAFTVSGECRGTLLEAPRGENGFGYDPLFYVERFDKTFAELSAETKNSISHRGAAVGALAELIQYCK